jgi:hypothetical protein
LGEVAVVVFFEGLVSFELAGFVVLVVVTVDLSPLAGEGGGRG